MLTEEEEEVRVTFDDLLMFATGTDIIPPLGFDSVPTILRLPIHALYDSFSKHIIIGIVQSPHFGLA